jgi:subtilase family serine protease
MNYTLRNYCKPYFRLSQHNRLSELNAPYFKSRKSALAEPEAAQLTPYTVPNLCTMYDWPTGLTGGGVIAIVEQGSGWVPSDMNSFFQSIGQPVPQIVDVSVDGTANQPNQHIGDPRDPDIEVALDIQIAAASYYVATGQPAVIRVYWAGDIAAAVQKATEDQCDVCSISWGSDEGQLR